MASTTRRIAGTRISKRSSGAGSNVIAPARIAARACALGPSIAAFKPGACAADSDVTLDVGRDVQSDPGGVEIVFALFVFVLRDAQEHFRDVDAQRKKVE